MQKMVSFRLDSEHVRALDKLAEAQDRNRSYLLSEAVKNYLEVQQWQIEQIKAGLAEAEAGKLIPHEKVMARVARWRRKR